MNVTINNGWILSLLFLAVSYLPLLFSKNGAKRLTNFSWINKKGKKLSFLVLILYVIMLILPLFHPITTNIIQLSAGVPIIIAGMLGIIISYHNYFTTPPKYLITKGLYKTSRNPIYFFTIVMCIGISILCTIYEMIPVLIAYIIIQHPIIKEEERYCSETYGDEYLRYKKKTPRYFLFR